MIITSVPSSIFLSLPWLVIGGGLVGKVLLSENLSRGNTEGTGLELKWVELVVHNRPEEQERI